MTFQKLLPNASPITPSIWLQRPFQTKFYLPPHRFPFALQLSFQLQLSLNILFQSQFSLPFVTSITDFTLVDFYTADFIWLHISIGDVSSIATSIEHVISFATFKYEFGFFVFQLPLILRTSLQFLLPWEISFYLVLFSQTSFYLQLPPCTVKLNLVETFVTDFIYVVFALQISYTCHFHVLNFGSTVDFTSFATSIAYAS